MGEFSRGETDSGVVRSIWWTLRIVFGVAPLVAGLDKFFNLLVVWEKYLAPPFAKLVPMSPTGFMHVVGIIEIVAGALVLFSPWPRLFSWVVAIWLWCIALDLIVGGFHDIAVRDVIMGISAACLARLTSIVVPGHAVESEARGGTHAQAHG